MISTIAYLCIGGIVLGVVATTLDDDERAKIKALPDAVNTIVGAVVVATWPVLLAVRFGAAFGRGLRRARETRLAAPDPAANDASAGTPARKADPIVRGPGAGERRH